MSTFQRGIDEKLNYLKPSLKVFQSEFHINSHYYTHTEALLEDSQQMVFIFLQGWVVGPSFNSQT